MPQNKKEGFKAKLSANSSPVDFTVLAPFELVQDTAMELLFEIWVGRK